LASPKTEVLGTVGQYVNENKILMPFRGGVPGDNSFIALKECISQVSKRHKALKHAEKRVMTHL
jgi:hypothetical protein